MKKTLTLSKSPTCAAIGGLRVLGIVVDVRGGNPIVRRARDRYDLAAGRVRHTPLVAYLSRADGAPVRPADVAAARAVLS